MIVQYHLIDIPYLGVVDDLTSRDGEPGENNYPFCGIRQRISAKCRNTNPALCLELLKDPKKEYDFTHKKKGMEFMPMYTCVDDVPEEIIYTYIEQVLYAICTYRYKGYLDFQAYNTKEHYTTQDGENDTVTSESDKLMDGAGSYSYEEVIAWKRKLPYLVKRLQDKSLQTGFHVMSAVISKQKCIKARESDLDNRKRSIMPRELIAGTIFTISPNGTVTGIVTENISDFQQSFCPWIRGDENSRDSYYDDMQELYKICDKLGIRLEFEDPLNYTSSFVNGLASDYIIENSRLAVNIALQQTDGGGLPLSVRNIISKLSLDELTQIPQIIKDAKGKQSQPTLMECIENTFMLFTNSDLCNEDNQMLLTRQQISDLCMYYCLYFGTSILLKTLSFADNGFLIRTATAEYFTLNVLQFVTENQGMGTEALIHKSGLVVLLNVRKINRSFAWTTVAKLTGHLKQSNVRKCQGQEPLPFKWGEVDDL